MDHRSEVVNAACNACLAAGLALDGAHKVIGDTIARIEEVQNILTDPAERIEWNQIRSQWVAIRSHVANALAKTQEV